MIRLLAVVALVACGSAHPRGSAPAPQAAAPDGGVTPDGAAPVVTHDDHPTARECEALFAHTLALELAARPADHQLGPAEQQALRDQMRAKHLGECRALARDTYRCIVAAATTSQLVECQASRSSSTSNSKVAPGGMTPPAPREP